MTGILLAAALAALCIFGVVAVVLVVYWHWHDQRRPERPRARLFTAVLRQETDCLDWRENRARAWRWN